MTFNEEDPEVSVRKHRPAIMGIIVALAVAVLAFLVFGWMSGEETDGSTRELAPGSETTQPATDGEAGTTAPATTEPMTAPATTTEPATGGTTAPSN